MQVSNRIVMKGYQKHHWSYNPEDAKDVIFLTIADHALIHRLTVYDEKKFMYRCKHTKNLLFTKRKVVNFMKRIEIIDYHLHFPF